MEKKITCPHCGSNNCFETAIGETLNYLCVNCGSTSSSVLKIGSEVAERAEVNSPPLITELKKIDNERQLVWYPAVISTNKGMLYPEGTATEWKWSVAPVVKLTEEERLQYPVPGKENEFYEVRLDIKGAKHFAPEKFIDALTELGAVMEK
jgi:DNA-directed RNA polymerase subunit RPC12/RpoP